MAFGSWRVYLGVLLTSEGNMAYEFDRWIGAASAGMQPLCRTVGEEGAE